MTAAAALGVAALAPGAAQAGSSAAARSAGPTFVSVDDWIAREAIPFSADWKFGAAVDRMMFQLGSQVSLLGFGEALHGGEEHLTLRNRVFQRLVEAHGYSAITIEITHFRAELVNDYIHGRGPATYEQIQDSGFSYGAGLYGANRELVEWMKRYNSDPAHKVKVSFYGTVASEQGETTESPRKAIERVLTYLQKVDSTSAASHQKIVEPLLGADADWEGPAALLMKRIMDKLLGGPNAPKTAPTAAEQFGASPRAQALRVAVENLDFELRMRRAELVARSDPGSFNDALYQASVARNVLALHAALARGESVGALVTMRDEMAAQQLVYIAERESGKVMVHLHNSHLRRTKTTLPWYEFWPTGAYLDQLFGHRFAVIGGAVGTSPANFIGAPNAGTVETRLLSHGTDCFLPVWRGRRLPKGVLATLPTRSPPTNPGVPYEPLSPQCLADLDGIAFFRTATHTRGMPAYG